MKTCTALLAASLLGLGGCAHLPDATVSYYLPTSEVTFKVIRTVACDAGGNPIIATAVTPSVRHFADQSVNPQTISFAKLKGDLSDNDVKFEFTEDGRLSAVNTTSTGQGEAILKTAITLTASVVKAAGPGMLLLTPPQCQQIKDFGGGKPLTVTYTGKVGLADGASTPLKPDADSEFYVSQLGAVFLPLTVTSVSHKVPAKPFDFSQTGETVAVIKARQPGTVHIKVEVPGVGKPLWEDDVAVATVGTVYELPIPRAGAFGTKKLSVAFADSGALKSVQYVANTGAGQALNVASSALTALQGDNAAQKAADVKGEADLIAQQQRLVACRADPTTCK